MKAAVVGSRQQLCILPAIRNVRQNSLQVHICRQTVQNNFEGAKISNAFRARSIMDIDDLLEAGQKLAACPYYASRDLHLDAEIVFMQYNYILDPKIRKLNSMYLNNSIIIVDEAHNVGKVCEDAASVQIFPEEIGFSIECLQMILRMVCTTSKLMICNF